MDGVRAGAASVMCSYNRINNTYGCENSKLMNGVLKGELGFQGFVMLDWNAQHTLDSANAGLDMLMPSGGSWGNNLTEAVRNGTVDEKRVADMATRYGCLLACVLGTRKRSEKSCALEWNGMEWEWLNFCWS